jgi:dihydropteroate synthase
MTITTHKATVMAILNVTPDSFSDGGSLATDDDILRAAAHALTCGAGILDVGGESTRPGALPVSESEEMARVVPSIKLIHKTFPEAVISVDTRKARVAQAAIDAGATMVNDISGLVYSGEEMLQVIAQSGVKLVIMHSQGIPETMQQHPSYPTGILKELDDFFRLQIELTQTYGISSQQLILDPGFGFGKTVEHNLTILTRLDELHRFGLPVMVGLSRKSFLTLGNRDIHVKEREALTAVALMVALQKNATYLRLHDIEIQMPVIRLAESLLEKDSDMSSTSALLESFC